MSHARRLVLGSTTLVLVAIAAAWLALGRGGAPVRLFAPRPHVAVPSAEACGDEGTALTFFALGDTGDDTDHRARVVAAMAAHARRALPAFIVLLGDNFYPHGVDEPRSPRFARDFEAAFPAASLGVPFHVVLGNHDHEGSCEAQLQHVSPSGRWRLPGRFYSLRDEAPDGATVDLFVLDTTPLVEHTVCSELQLAWLADGLATSAADWQVVIGHHAIVSGGAHGDCPTLQARLAPLLRTGGVDLYLCGHDHALQVLRIPGGPLAVVSGSGSRVRSVEATADTLYSESAPGFVRVRIDRQRLCVTVVSPEGIRYEHHVARPLAARAAQH
jgi:tartrate-resistant acid phosphatase type 5